ncbi:MULTISPECIES: hypothetical protein [Rhizobium]|uniref:DUF4145 domain-containing protein n=1 Tax=Rhizobium leguminosarum TaxID=384 RepID=A0A7K3VRR5_RHILE|nr:MULTISPECIES: hypothetical protein [Rhizobium]MBX5164824.1 hypothetical protein [Rhizobium sp. NZLR4b]NEK19886.1 hypothetical protein [Rhizobium leguminosarum]
MMGQCVVCGSAAEIGSNGDARQYRCDRCGPFVLTGTAVAVLKSRTQPTGKVNDLIVAKVSHYIRTHSTEEDWLEIDSALIDEMVAQKLPSPNQQIENLLRWMTEQVGEDHLAALEFSATDVCAIMGAASEDSAGDLIDEATNSGLIQFVPDDCYRLTKAAWDRLSASEPPHIPRQQRGDFVDIARMAELRAISNSQFDLTRLVRMCEEINSAWGAGNTISVAMLARAMVDHVPPIFGQTSFSQVTSQASRSIRGSFEQIQTALRHIADGALHTQIRRRETIPTTTQVDFRQSFDVLLGELVRILRS